MGNRKSAGRCTVCKKWVALDDHQVVIDLTIAAIRPGYEKAAEVGALGEGAPPVEDLIKHLLDEMPMCSKCWHETDRIRSLSQGALELADKAAGLMLPEEAQFRWEQIR